MTYPDGTPNKSHTSALVPVIIVDDDFKFKNAREAVESPEISGSLSDIAPTILKLLGEKQPREMTGKSLI